MIEISKLQIQKNYQRIFSGFSITIFPSAVICIHGENGIGKTSLLRAISGIGTFQGAIKYSGENILEMRETYYAVLAYLAHSHALDLELTVLENLRFYSKINKTENALESSLAVFELQPYKNIKIEELSQGFAKKVAFTRLLLSQKTVWLLDEPFANLDKVGKDRLIEMFRVRAMNKGIVIFTAQEKCSEDGIDNIYLRDYKDA